MASLFLQCVLTLLSVPTRLQKDSRFQEKLKWSSRLYKSASPCDRGTGGEAESPPPLFWEGNWTPLHAPCLKLPPQTLVCLVSSVLRSVKLFIALAILPQRCQCQTPSKTDHILLAISVGTWPWCRVHLTACNQQSSCSPLPALVCLTDGTKKVMTAAPDTKDERGIDE